MSHSSDEKPKVKGQKGEVEKKAALKPKSEGAELETLKAEREDLINQLQRLQAEFENYKKRTDKANQQMVEYAKKDLIVDMLPILDTFELSLKHKEPGCDKFASGVEMIYNQLMRLLEKEGARQIDCVGKKFDPYRHEVLLIQEMPGEEDIVLEEFQKGYMLRDMVIRHSKVKVSKAPIDRGKEKEDGVTEKDGAKSGPGKEAGR